MTSAFQYAEQDGIAVVTFDLADRPVNVLTPTVLEELEGHLDRLAGRSDLTGLVIATGKADFCAGADVDLMAGIETEAEGRAAAARGQAVFRKLAVLSVPTCAALRGACLGGGLELALACDYRVAVDDPATQLGLPEVRLGIIPGFGGTQRLPRLIPLPAALGMILTGRSLRARPARRRGLVDRLARPGAEVTAARALCRQPPPPRRNGSWTRWPGVAGVIWWLARRRVRKETGERMPAPLAALAAVRAGLTAGEPAGFAREAALLGACLVSPESRNLVRLFQLRRAAGEGPT